MRRGELAAAASVVAITALLSAPAGALAESAVSFASGPQDPTATNDSTPTFVFSTGDSAASFECSLDGATPEPCSSPHTTDPLDDGSHRLDVRAGSTGTWSARHFSIDTTAPETVLVSAPPARTRESSARFEFVAGEDGASFECSLDEGAFAGCESPWSPGELAAGRHLVAVRALDALGNRDASPAVAVFTVEAASVSSSGTTLTSGVRMLAQALAENLDGVVRVLGSRETPAILRSGQVSVAGMRALVPGTLTVAAAPGSAGPTVLAGTLSSGAGATGTLTLRPTEAGRALLRRGGSVPVLLTARFTSRGLSMSSSRHVRLVRDWLTLGEARQAVSRELRRGRGARPRRLALTVQTRCGSGCLDIRASWLHRRQRFATSGRVRQLSGRLSANLGAAARQR